MLATLRSWIARRFAPKSLGERGENAAAKFLRRKGYHILARHLDLRPGELDLVAADGRTVVFVEVKTRSTVSAGTPAEAIDERKMQRMTQAALAYLKSHGLLNHAARFDVVAVIWPSDRATPVIEHIENAFEAVGQGQFFR
jgi:putative endonuclease